MAVASVVIPAHQEGAAIGACLESLLADAAVGELEVVVAANGCTDDTVEVARSTARRLGHDVVVVDLPEAGKAAAIRAAERRVSSMPRVFVDADVRCPTGTVRELVAALEAGAEVAVPRRLLDLRFASRPARLYHRSWSELPWVQSQLTGRGVYAVGRGARDTYGELPEVVADDRFVTTRVPRCRAVVVAAEVAVRPPGRLADVVRVRRRVYRGNRDAAVPAHDQGLAGRWRYVAGLTARPATWPGMAVFLVVTAVAKAPHRRGSGWGRDPVRSGAT